MLLASGKMGLIKSRLYFFVLVSLAYALIFMQNVDHFNGLDQNSTFLDCWYFAFTTCSTVGYGDIGPKTQFGKGLVISLQIIVILELADDFFSAFGYDVYYEKM